MKLSLGARPSFLSVALPPSNGRRQLLDDGFRFAGGKIAERYGPEYRGSSGIEPTQRWLRNTPLLQHDHPKIRLLALKLTQLKSGREKALACFEFVRKLEFKCSINKKRAGSVDVLAAGMGDGFGKGTLFIAMLRAIGVPARMRVVLLHPTYLTGLAGLDGTLAEHAYTEVWIEGEWLAVDSYVVDLDLGLRARMRLLFEGRNAGYGVHAKGQVSWDARSSSFGQFSSEDPASLPLMDLGTYDDVQQFQHSLRPEALSQWANRKRLQFASIMANRRIRGARERPAVDAFG